MNRQGNYHLYHSVNQPKANRNILLHSHLLLSAGVCTELLCLLRICVQALVCLPSLAVCFGRLSTSPRSCLDIVDIAVICSGKLIQIVHQQRKNLGLFPFNLKQLYDCIVKKKHLELIMRRFFRKFLFQ